MLDYLNDLGGLLGLLGVVISLVGLIAALVAAYRAKQAREAAEEARNATKAAMDRVLTTVDLERAIGLTQRIKMLTRDGQWEISLEQYQPLRLMLRNIRARYPDSTPELKQRLERAILNLAYIENGVNEAVLTDAEPSELLMFNVLLNEIQVYLEEIASPNQLSEN